MSGKVNVDKSEMKQGSSLLNLNEVAETVGDWNKLLDEEEQKPEFQELKKLYDELPKSPPFIAVISNFPFNCGKMALFVLFGGDERVIDVETKRLKGIGIVGLVEFRTMEDLRHGLSFDKQKYSGHVLKVTVLNCDLPAVEPGFFSQYERGRSEKSKNSNHYDGRRGERSSHMVNPVEQRSNRYEGGNGGGRYEDLHNGGRYKDGGGRMNAIKGRNGKGHWAQNYRQERPKFSDKRNSYDGSGTDATLKNEKSDREIQKHSKNQFPTPPASTPESRLQIDNLQDHNTLVVESPQSSYQQSSGFNASSQDNTSFLSNSFQSSVGQQKSFNTLAKPFIPSNIPTTKAQPSELGEVGMAEEAQSPTYFIDSSPASAYIPMTADGTPYTGTFESNGQQPNVVYSSPEGYAPVSPASQPHPELRLMQPAAAHAPASMYQSMPQQPVMVQYSGVPMQGPGGGQLVYVQYPVYIQPQMANAPLSQQPTLSIRHPGPPANFPMIPGQSMQVMPNAGAPFNPPGVPPMCPSYMPIFAQPPQQQIPQQQPPTPTFVQQTQQPQFGQPFYLQQPSHIGFNQSGYNGQQNGNNGNFGSMNGNGHRQRGRGSGIRGPSRYNNGNRMNTDPRLPS
uniref:RRM domain-containing protein n=1 Tax=Acrobeloides nanus TaxID=290746 RepID=A0A914CLT4_9BILA